MQCPSDDGWGSNQEYVDESEIENEDEMKESEIELSEIERSEMNMKEYEWSQSMIDKLKKNMIIIN